MLRFICRFVGWFTNGITQKWWTIFSENFGKSIGFGRKKQDLWDETHPQSIFFALFSITNLILSEFLKWF